MTIQASTVQEDLQALAPDRIDDLWTKLGEEDFQSQDAATRGMTHLLAERLFDWADDDMIDELLEDESRLERLVVEVADAAFQLGFNAKQLQAPGTLVSGNCLSCNTSIDNGGCNHHHTNNSAFHGRHSRIDLKRAGPQNEAIVSHTLHRSVTLLALTAHLLSKRKSYKLAALMTPEPPPDVAYSEYVPSLASSGERGFCCILQLFALVDNASTAFPKATMYAAACLSLTVSRRPSQAFALLDPEAMVRSIYNYLQPTFELIHNTECIVEECYGVAAFVNILPLLYCFGDWKNIHKFLTAKQSNLVVSLATMTFNILHNVNRGKEEEDDRVDRRFDTEIFPELIPAVIFIDPRIKSDVLREHPMSWAVVTALEVLVKWASRGIPVVTECIPTTDAGPEPISDLFAECQPQLESLCDEARPIGIQLMKNLLEGNHKLKDFEDFPAEFLLSKRMEKLAKWCAYCSKENKVELCAGGCMGLARYCSKEHQKKHWRRHKEFCKHQTNN